MDKSIKELALLPTSATETSQQIVDTAEAVGLTIPEGKLVELMGKVSLLETTEISGNTLQDAKKQVATLRKEVKFYQDKARSARNTINRPVDLLYNATADVCRKIESRIDEAYTKIDTLVASKKTLIATQMTNYLSRESFKAGLKVKFLERQDFCAEDVLLSYYDTHNNWLSSAGRKVVVDIIERGKQKSMLFNALFRVVQDASASAGLLVPLAEQEVESFIFDEDFNDRLAELVKQRKAQQEQIQQLTSAPAEAKEIREGTDDTPPIHEFIACVYDMLENSEQLSNLISKHCNKNWQNGDFLTLGYDVGEVVKDFISQGITGVRDAFSSVNKNN